MNKSSNNIVIITFLLLLGFFLLNQSFRIIPDLAYNENRMKAEKPEFDLSRLDYFPKKYEAYLTDNFSLRGFFLKSMSRINTDLWKKSPTPDKVIIGKDNWLFNVDKELDCYYGKRNFDEKQLEEVLQEFLYRKAILDSMGIKMYLVIHPTKYSVYPEMLPGYLIRKNTENSAVQLVNYIKNHSEINILYTRDFLMPLKNEYQLYHKNDNHWNEMAGYFVSKAMLQIIDPDIPELPLSFFRADTINRKGNLAYMTGNAEAFAEDAIRLTPESNDAEIINRYSYEAPKSFPYKNEYQVSYMSKDESLPNALIIRDSYANALLPYLRNSFHYSTFIWDNWHYGFNLDIIKKEEPDIVIYMVLESTIPNIYENGLSKR